MVVLRFSLSHSLSLSLSLSFYSIGATGPGGPEFTEYKDHLSGDVQFLLSLAELPPNPDKAPRLALVSGRTADNPRLLTEAIAVRTVLCIRNGYFWERPGRFCLSHTHFPLSIYIERLYLYLFRKTRRPHGSGIGTDARRGRRRRRARLHGLQQERLQVRAPGP